MRVIVTLGILCLLTSCAARTPPRIYEPLPERLYDIEEQSAVDLTLATLQDLGFVVDNVGEISQMSVITTAERQSEDNDEDGVECTEEWKGLALGGWVEETGGVVLTVRIRTGEGGAAVSIRESGVRGCEPTGAWSRQFFELYESRLGG